MSRLVRESFTYTGDIKSVLISIISGQRESACGFKFIKKALPSGKAHKLYVLLLRTKYQDFILDE